MLGDRDEISSLEHRRLGPCNFQQFSHNLVDVIDLMPNLAQDANRWGICR